MLDFPQLFKMYTCSPVSEFKYMLFPLPGPFFAGSGYLLFVLHTDLQYHVLYEVLNDPQTQLGFLAKCSHNTYFSLNTLYV